MHAYAPWHQCITCVPPTTKVIHQHRPSLRAAFLLFDTGRSGRVGLEDFKIALECLNDVTLSHEGGLKEAHVLQLGGTVEKDAEGFVDYMHWLDGFEVQVSR